MASEMVERVARAILSAGQERERDRVASWPHYVPGTFYATPWDDLDHVVQDDMIALASAAIEEMRKPTTKMLNAAGAAMSPGKRPTPERVSDKAKHGIRYRAMIDAALKE